MRAAAIALALMAASCSSTRPAPAPPSAPRYVGIPREATAVCVDNEDGTASCRTADEVRAFIRTLNAAP